MKAVKMVLCAAAVAAVGTLVAQDISLNKAADWNKNPAIKDGDGSLVVSKRVMMSGALFEVDPAKTYTIKCSTMAADIKGNDKSWVLLGFQVYDKDNKQIFCEHVNAFPNAISEVAEDAAKGAKTLKVKDASKFRKLASAILVRDAKEDFSDLPNRKIIGRGGIESITKQGDVWEITLVKPLLADVKAGTVVREHGGGGYLYTGGTKYVGDKWITMTGTITGTSKFGWGSKGWPVGTVKARPMILVNWSNKDLTTLFKDVSVTVK